MVVLGGGGGEITRGDAEHIQNRTIHFQSDLYHEEFVKYTNSGIKVKLTLDNDVILTISTNTTYIFKESGNIELNYKVCFGNFPIDLSLYKSTSYKIVNKLQETLDNLRDEGFIERAVSSYL